MKPEQPSSHRSPLRYLILAVVSFDLFGLFSGLGFAVAGLFVLVGLVFLGIYFYKLPKDQPAANRRFERQQTTWTNQAPNRNREPGQEPSSDWGNFNNWSLERKNRVIAIGVSLVALFFIVVVASIIINEAGSSESYSEEFDPDLDLGVRYYNASQADSALWALRRSVATHPENPVSRYYLANTHWLLQNWDSAYYFFGEAVRINPEYREARYGQGQVRYNQERYDEALSIATELKSRFPDYTDPDLLAGDCWYVRKDYTQAIPYYESAYNAGVRSEALCHIMAWIYDNRGDVERAKPLYKEAFEQNNGNKEVAQRLAELYPGVDGNVYREALRSGN